MLPGTPRVEKLRRAGHLALALVGSTAARPAAPHKITLCLTYRCQYRCRTCNIWQRPPQNELSTDEVAAFVRANPDVTWVDLTGGEIFLRPDIEEILDAVSNGWKQLAVLHFPTNGFLTDRIVRGAERVAGRGQWRTIVTVSLDGDERTNDEVRGVSGGFARQVATFNALRRVPGITVVFGMTLSSYNAGRLAETFDACAREVPGLTAGDVHLNVAQVSDHYYGNTATSDLLPQTSVLRDELLVYRRFGRRRRTAAHLLEHAYLRYLDRFLVTGQTPMRCHALRASCFIDPCGVVYPCIAYSRPIGRLRDTAMKLAPIWAALSTRRLQAEIWEGDCPQCWAACEAHQAILGNALAGRWRRPPSRGADPAPARVERGR
jgi:radical SAM protein with 4Fe4S-binding SPASM domain